MIDLTRALSGLEEALSKITVGAAAASTSQCGPSPEEIGAAVLASAGPAIAVTCGALWALLRLWRGLAAARGAPENGADPTAAWAALGIVGGVASAAGAYRCLTLFGGLDVARDAVTLLGSLHLGVSLLLWRGLAALGRPRAAAAAPWIAAALVFAPAIPMTLSMSSGETVELWVGIWLGGSLQGATGPLVLGALSAEIGARRWWLRRAARRA